MSSRETILHRLQQAAAPQPMPGPWPSRRQFPDLTAHFLAAVEKAHGEPHIVHNADELATTLQRICTGLNARQLVTTAVPQLDNFAWDALLPDVNVVSLTGLSDITTHCARADVGISGVEAAFAATGSVVLRSGADASRLATLLPTVHIALVPETVLVPDLLTWAQKRPAPLPANLIFVSGPSKTADIEQTMAIGVHGPGRFIVILLKENPA